MLLLDAANFVSKLLLYSVSAGAIGAALHAALGLVASRRLFGLFASLLAGVAILRLLILNAQMGGSLAAAFSVDQLAWTWAGGGRPALALLLGAALLIAASRIRHWSVPVLAALSISASFALTGHTTVLAEPGLAPWIVAVHLLIAGVWLAAPVTLWPYESIPDADVVTRTRRFSQAARFLVPVLFLSGIYLYGRINGDLPSLFNSGYGQLIAAKLLLASSILGLGALNMTLISRKLAAEPMKGRAALRATLRLDAILFVAILCIIAAATTFFGPTE